LLHERSSLYNRKQQLPPGRYQAQFLNTICI
jgi:hypothetical protein